jgi:hypothetical protein
MHGSVSRAIVASHNLIVLSALPVTIRIPSIERDRSPVQRDRLPAAMSALPELAATRATAGLDVDVRDAVRNGRVSRVPDDLALVVPVGAHHAGEDKSSRTKDGPASLTRRGWLLQLNLA